MPAATPETCFSTTLALSLSVSSLARASSLGMPTSLGSSTSIGSVCSSHGSGLCSDRTSAEIGLGAELSGRAPALRADLDVAQTRSAS